MGVSVGIAVSTVDLFRGDIGGEMRVMVGVGWQP
jgi:hypothetical protein